MFSHYLRKKGVLRFQRIELQSKLLKKIFLWGLPESISQLATPVTTICMNRILAQMIGNIGVNAFSIAIFLGTSEGLQPLFGQSYSAKEDGDMKYYFRMGLLINFIGSILINVLLLFVGSNSGDLNKAALCMNSSACQTERPGI